MNSLIKPVYDIHWHIKICERVEIKGIGFTSQQVIEVVLEYAKEPITTQSYTKAHPYAKEMGAPSDQKDTSYARRRSAPSDNTSTTPKEVPVLKTNNDCKFTLDGKFYLLKPFVLEEIYLGKLPKAFWDTIMEKKMDQSTNKDDTNKTKNRQENNREHVVIKAAATNTETKSKEADYPKLVFSDLTFTVPAAPDKVQAHYALSTTCTAIAEEPTIKGICAAAGAHMQVSAAST